MASPQIVVEVAFSSDPLAASPTWTDISAYVIDDAALTIRRGRQYERNQVEAGTATLVLTNKDRRFDPTHTSGPYYPNVRPMRRIRISAIWASVTYRLFSGYVEAWPPQQQGRNATVTIRCVDAFKLFQSLKLRREIILNAIPLQLAGPIGYGALTGFTGARIFSAQGNLPSVTGAVDIVGTLPNGSIASDSILLDGVTEVFAGSADRFATITGVTLPIATVAGQTVTVTATNRFLGESSGFALDTILNTVGWPSADRVIYNGNIQLPEATLSDTTTILSHIQRIAESEHGVFFIDGAGRAVFHDRHYRITFSVSTASQGTFGDLLSDPYQYEDVQLSYDDALIANDVAVTREGGAIQAARDATSQARYFARSLAKSGLLFTSDNQAEAEAQWLLQQYKEPAVRVASLTLAGQLNDNLWPQLLSREISDRITVRHRPVGGGATIEQDGFIEAVQYTIRRGAWRSTWQLSPTFTTSWFILDSSALGVGALAY